LAVIACVCLAGAGAASGAGQTVASVKPGDRGPAVVQIQRKLGIAADGVFGPQTRRAVTRFQSRHGLVADGVVGPETRRALGLPAFKASSVSSGGDDSGGAAPGVAPSPSPTRLPAALRRIAQCESGGNPRAIGGKGRYRGKYQFTMATWRAHGGSGDPIDASEAEQDRVALRLYRARGTAPWPACA
jgi:peptidoglycan hydrolase-like protein with peptidoglycan-binding domain